MKTKQYVKGDNLEEKFESVNKTFNKIIPRMNKKIVGAIPPSQIFASIEKVGENREVFNMLFPCSGTLSKVGLYVEKLAKGSVEFELVITGVNGIKGKKFYVLRETTLEEVNLDVDGGDLLTLKVDDPEKVGAIHIGATFDLKLKDIKKENILLNDPTLEVDLDG